MSLFQNLDMAGQVSLTLLVIVLLVLAVLTPVALRGASRKEKPD